MRCCDCEFRNSCDESETVLTSFVSCEKRNMLKSLKSASIEAVNPNANVSFEKSADEMFSDLGFRKNTSVCFGEDKGVLLYEKPVSGNTDCLSIYFNDHDVCYYNLAHLSLWMQYGVVAAIKKKMEELGWDSENC